MSTKQCVLGQQCGRTSEGMARSPVTVARGAVSRLGLPVLAILWMAGAGGAHAAECGEVSIAEMNWASAGLTANVDKIILEAGYGCNVTLVTGDTLPTFSSMTERGQPDVAPEIWVNLIYEPLQTAIAEGKVVNAAEILSDGGEEGWWVPNYVIEAHPDIKSVEDALKHPELFPAPEDATKGAVFNCPSGWACQLATESNFKAFEAEAKGFTLVDTGSAAGLDGSIANAYARNAGWLGYYWAPTALLGKYPMTRLTFGVEHDAEEWARCTSIADCPDPKPNSWPVGEVFTTVTKQFAENNPVAMGYFEARSWGNDTVNGVLSWMIDNQGTNEDGARYFLEEFPEVWEVWVAPEIAEKVKASL